MLKLSGELNSFSRATELMFVSISTHLCTAYCKLNGINSNISERIVIEPNPLPVSVECNRVVDTA